MKRLNRLMVLAVVLAVGVAQAGELEGVKMPDEITVDGKTLKLNGMGLRTKQILFIFKVYVAGLYLENKSSDPKAILAADGPRKVQMHMLRDLDKGAIIDAVKNGFEQNNKEAMPKLKERLDQFIALIPDLKSGQTLSLVYVPEKGTTVEGAKGTYSAPGKDFADALFSVWLGNSPVDETLKKGMLGQKL